MCFGSSKSTSDSSTNSTATSAPTNPAIQPAVTNEVQAATSLASQPLQQYTGNLVAPLNDTQNQAIGQINGAQGLAQPYLTQAASLATQGAAPITTTPFSADAVNQYESPYLSDVLSSTEAAENLQDKQAQQSLQGNITAAGAWGGDRSAVVQSELAGQQATANNATNANIENEGYNTALGEFNTVNNQGIQSQEANDANSLAAASSLGNIGTSMENTALNGANSLFNAGTAEQQVEQENLNVPYEQYLQQQAYPYQQLDFESGILGSAAGTSGTTATNAGSSTGTQSQSTPLGPQLLGLGLSAASFLKSGGRTKLAEGGFAPLPAPASLSSFIPTSTASGKSGLTSLSAQSPNVSFGGGSGTAQSSSLPSASQFEGAANGMSDLGEDLFGNAVGYGGLFGATPPTVSMANISPSALSLSDFSMPDLKKDGGRARLADGGNDDSGDDTAGFDALLDSLYPGPANGSLATATPRPATSAPAGATAMSLQDTPHAWRGQATNYADLDSSTGPTWNDGTPVIADDDEGEAQAPAPQSLATAAPVSSAAPGGLGAAHPARVLQSAYTPKPDWRRALLTAGTSMMAARGGNGLSNVGAGLQAGANEYYSQLDKDNNPQVDHSGPTTLVRYADGTVVDTGLPTEAAINAKASNDYKIANSQQVAADREAAIKERGDAAAAGVSERAEAAKEAAANRTLMLQIAEQNANAGKFGQPVAGTGVDASGKTVPGVYVTNTKTGNPEFHPGVVLTQKDVAGGNDAELKPEAIKFYGEQLARGDTSVLQNLGRGPVASKNAINVRNAAYDFSVANKMDPSAAMSAVAEFTGQKAAERTLGVTSARIGLGASELEQLIPQAMDASKALPRSQFPTANSVMQAFQTGSGDPRVRDLGLALQAAKGAYSQVLTRGGMPTDAARATTDELFSSKDPESVLQTAMDRVRKETAAVRKAPGMVRQDLRDDARGQSTQASGPVVPPAPSGVPAGSAYSPSRKQWRDPKGRLYNAQGQPVQ